MKVITRSALAVLAIVVAGCSHGHDEEGEGCPELCEHAAACPGDPMTEESCLASCSQETERAEEAGCSEARASYLECRSHAEDTCDPEKYEEECSIQLDSLNGCLDGA